MMVLVLIASLIASPCYAEWAVSYGTSFSNTAYSIQQTNDNGYILAGGYGFWILKLDCGGSVNWQMEFRLDPFDEAQAIRQTQDGGYVVAGVSSHNYADEVWVLKLHPDGSLDWQKTYGGSGSYDRAYSIEETVDQAGNADGYIVAGSAIHQTGGSWDIWAIKLNLDGSVNWQKTYGLHTDGAYAIRQTFDQQGDPDGYIVAGSTGYYGSGIWVLRLKPDGTVNWHKIYLAVGSASAQSIQQAFNMNGNPAGYIVAGGLGSEAWVLKLTQTGAIDWQQTYGGDQTDLARSIRQTRDGGFVVAGQTASFGAGGNDVWLLKLSGAGSIQWERTFGGDGADGAHEVQQTRDGGYVVAGYTWSFGGSPDMWVLKVNEQGGIPDCNAQGASAAVVSTPSITLFDTPAPTVISSDAAVAVPEVTVIEPNYSQSVNCLYSQTDSDSDGLQDELEKSTGTDLCDDDSDNDGLIDGPGSGEDVNANGTVDPGETDPRLADTDGDGIPDGIEKGLTEPEGRDTDMDTFVPDADPQNTTNAAEADSDGDGFPDGLEDGNQNGAVDPWEPDPANARSYPAAIIQQSKGFNLVALHTEGDLSDWLPDLADSFQIEKVLAYDTETETFVTLTPDETSPESFVLHGGEALIAYSSAQKDIALVEALCPALELKPGLNLVGISCRAESYRAFEFLNELGRASTFRSCRARAILFLCGKPSDPWTLTGMACRTIRKLFTELFQTTRTLTVTACWMEWR
jgi:hypothetical protein